MRTLQVYLFVWMILASSVVMRADTPDSTGTTKNTSSEEPVKVQYPDRVLVPKAYPSVTSIAASKLGTEKHVVLPAVLYLLAHYRGWQACLKDRGLKELSSEDKYAASTNEPYSPDGRFQGYNDCVHELQRLRATGISLEELHKICKNSELPLSGDVRRGPPPIPKSQPGKSIQGKKPLPNPF